MPVRAPRICSCGRVVPSGARCACQAAKAKAHDARRGTAASRGYDSRWRRESKAFLALPGNERCACGCGRIANMVDHRIAPKGDDRLFWDRSNWQAFNVACNSRKAIRSEGGFGRAPSNMGEADIRGHDLTGRQVSSEADAMAPNFGPDRMQATGGRVETLARGVETARGPQRKVPPNSAPGELVPRGPFSGVPGIPSVSSKDSDQ